MTQVSPITVLSRAGRRPAFRRAAGFLIALAALAWPATAEAQLDPLLFLKRSLPTVTTASYRANVLLAVDTAARMQYDADGNYYDPMDYTRGNFWDSTLGVTPTNTALRYRRKYHDLKFDGSGGSQKYTTSTISIAGDLQPSAYSRFYARTRIGVAKDAMMQAVQENMSSVRFGLLKMRQSNPRIPGLLNDGLVANANALQSFPTDSGSLSLWRLTRAVVDADNRSIETITAPLVRPDTANSNQSVLTTLGKGFTDTGALLPAGNDDDDEDDAALAHMLDDLKAEASRLIQSDTVCLNTVAVLVVGGGEGTGGHTPSAQSIASSFLNISGRRVPIYVIAIAPDPSALTSLEAIATNSGGQFFHVTRDEIEAAAAAGVPVPKVVRAINLAVQHGFAAPSDVNSGALTEHQVTSPVIGTVDLKGASDITGSTLPNTEITNTQSGEVIPQRANVMVTAGFAIPSFEGRLRAYRVYKPVADITRPTGYRFQSDGTALWVARTPTEEYCNDADASCRNIFTVLPDGTTVAFTASNVATLAPYLNTWDPEGLIQYVRTQPLGAIVGATPAFMDPPSLDPPPDPEYPAFVDDNKDRRTLVFVGANDGMMHAIDARTGVEVWAFIPFNLLPKLRTLRDGQGVDGFEYFVDSSAKVADVKIDGKWRTMLIFGEGPGGTFYQAFDVTLEGIANTISPTSDSVSTLLNYFSNGSRIQFSWAFPRYSVFNVSKGRFGDVDSAKGATEAELSVGQSWSDPAVGQVGTAEGKYAVITGSGFLPYSEESAAHRNGIKAGRALYLLDAGDGELFDWQDVGDDSQAEQLDNCTTTGSCTMMKNALQADAVATGPSDSRYITKTYIGDLDGKVWRFDINLSGTQDTDGMYKPEFASGTPVQLANVGADQPIFASMATVAVGTEQYIFFGSGSDLLPSRGVSTVYKLYGVLDQGPTGTVTFAHTLARVDGAGDDEAVSAFPAVAGDIVFFSTTTYKPENPCGKPDANLYALTFVGGAAYDSSGNNKVEKNESPRVRTLASAGRATAPFIVDQHLVFGAGNKVELFGDPTDFNNGVGHVGVRILSWRELR